MLVLVGAVKFIDRYLDHVRRLQNPGLWDLRRNQRHASQRPKRNSTLPVLQPPMSFGKSCVKSANT